MNSKLIKIVFSYDDDSKLVLNEEILSKFTDETRDGLYLSLSKVSEELDSQV